jgi:hypothetical protein
MTSRLAVFSSLLVAAVGCLPDDPPVNGRLLYPGINIENPAFADYGVLDGEPWVFFNVRRRRPDQFMAGQVDIYRVQWESTRLEQVIAGVSERPEWSNRETDAEGATFYMIEERFDEGGGRSVGTLARVTLEEGLAELIPDVLNYSLHSSRQRYLYRKAVPGMNKPELHLRDLSGQDRNLGPLGGQAQFVGPNKLYYITGGDEQTMVRLVGWDSEPQSLRRKVTRFELQYQEKLAIVTLNEGSMSRQVILDLDTLKERPMPVDNPCCWLGLRGNTAVFAESATARSPAKLHSYDIVTEKHDVIVMPEGLLDVRSIMPRSPFSDSVIIDSANRLALMTPAERQGDPPTVRLLPLRDPKVPRFTADGKHLIYIEEEPQPPPPAVSSTSSGRLMAQDAEDWEAPPRALSPVGASVLIDPSPGFLLPGDRPRQVIFWARFGLGASDLYLTDLDSRQTLKLAVGIGAVAIGGRNVLGVVRINQDLTGDLVHRDFLSGEEQVIEHSVAAASTRDDPVFGPIVAFVVRERMASSLRNGLWAAPLKLLPPPEERRNVLVIPAPPPPADSGFEAQP